MVFSLKRMMRLKGSQAGVLPVCFGARRHPPLDAGTGTRHPRKRMLCRFIHAMTLAVARKVRRFDQAHVWLLLDLWQIKQQNFG
jgi:hypothetical protein